jgi:hypothetical protein
LAQKTGGSIVTITAALARNPIRGVAAARALHAGDCPPRVTHLVAAGPSRTA